MSGDEVLRRLEGLAEAPRVVVLSGFVEFIRQRPATAWEAMQDAFRPNLSPLHARLAFQETLAHLEYLRLRDRLTRAEEDGTSFYEVVRA